MISDQDTVEAIAGLRVAVTGACGTVGRELVRQVIQAKPQSVIATDHNESALFFLGEEYRADPRVRVRLADVRDRDAMREQFRDVDVVFHSAALKHVPLCEDAPLEAIQTNIEGAQNVLDAALANGVSRVLFTSSDKAVNPTNVMGTSKLMAERLVTAADGRSARSIAISTRFGNVLGSRGSVLPVFDQQIRAGGPVTLTDPEMTRFIMTLHEAVALVLQSTFVGHGGEVFITKMPIARIEDLAEIMIEELAPIYGHQPSSISIEQIGIRPGEKLYEELMNDEETRRTYDIGDFLVVHPALREDQTVHGGAPATKPYNSALEAAMTREELRDYLKRNDLLTAGGITK